MDSAATVTQIIDHTNPISVFEGIDAVTQLMEENTSIVEFAVKEARQINPQITEDELESFLIDFFEDEIFQTLEQIELHKDNYLQAKRRFKLQRVKKRYRDLEKAEQLRKTNIINIIRELQIPSDFDIYTNFYDTNKFMSEIEKPYILGTGITYDYGYLYDNNDLLNLNLMNKMGDTLSKTYKVPKIDLTHISRIIDSFIEKEEIFSGINKKNILKMMHDSLNESYPMQNNMSEMELEDRIEKMMVIESMSNILSDLTPTELSEFDKASKRGKFF